MATSENVFGLGFIKQDPACYGAQVLREDRTTGNVQKSKQYFTLARTVAITTVVGATLVWLAVAHFSPIQHISSYGGVASSTQADDRGLWLWNTYLEELNASRSFSQAQVDHTRAFFLKVRETIDRNFPLPHAGPAPDGTLQLAWDSGEHHVDVDIHPTGVFEWFYTNRATNEINGKEDCEPGSFSPELSRYLHYIIEKTGGKKEFAQA